MRLEKFICKSTEFTKREAIQEIHAGHILVNDIIVLDESIQVHENNTITLNGQRLKPRPFRYLLMHKPANTICSNADGDYPSLYNQLDIDGVHGLSRDELHIAGRLDVDTTGLVLITDDGRWTYNITRPDKDCKKVYRVGLSYGIPEHKIATLVERFKQGIQLQGEQGLTQPALLEVLPSTKKESREVLLTIIEGKYHQVKRMFSAVGNRVLSLHREKIGEVQLDVEEGHWRFLTAHEVSSFTR